MTIPLNVVGVMAVSFNTPGNRYNTFISSFSESGHPPLYSTFYLISTKKGIRPLLTFKEEFTKFGFPIYLVM